MSRGLKAIIEKVQDQHPYRVKGKPETTNQYNEGWSDACDAIEGEIEKIELPKPDCHFQDENGKWVWSYSKELIESWLK